MKYLNSKIKFMLEKFKVLVTGGAGFIGSSLSRYLIEKDNLQLVVLDKLTYASNLQSLSSIENNPRFELIKGDICDTKLVSNLLDNFKPTYVFHLAAESHVDRSIQSPDPFIQSNIIGTYSLIKACYDYWCKNNSNPHFRFIHVSTDEVYGSLNTNSRPSKERDFYDPSSPYSASKAASDLLVNAWFKTYQFPAIITHCTNNYGEYQHSEKLIPTIIMSAFEGKSIPIYGEGKNSRDWLYVQDHVEALYLIAQNGRLGEIYNLCGLQELTNNEMADKICSLLDKNFPRFDKESYKHLIQHVRDRPGHDLRYAIDAEKVHSELHWRPKMNLEEGLLKTIKWIIKEHYEGNYLSRWKRHTPLSSNSIHF